MPTDAHDVDFVDSICRSVKAVVEMAGHHPCKVEFELPYETLADIGDKEMGEDVPERVLKVLGWRCESCTDIHVQVVWLTETGTQWSQEKSDERLFGGLQS